MKLGQNSKLRLIHCDDSISEQSCDLTNSLQIEIGDGASLDYYKMENINDFSSVSTQVCFEMGKESKLTTFGLSLNGKLIRNKIIVNFNEEHSVADLNGLYLMDKQQEAEGDFVQLMTIHAAKGLEFDIVFVYSMCEGIFPSERSVSEGGRDAMEEERRLAYVAFTRARKQLYISDARGYSFVLDRTKLPSRFVKEINEDSLVTAKEIVSMTKNPENFKNASPFTPANLSSSRYSLTSLFA